MHMDRVTRSLVLLLVGIALLTIVLRGSYRFYVIEAMHWPLLVTGVVFVVLAVADTVLALRAAPSEAHGASDHADHHEHDHEPRRLPWLLAVPAMLLLFVVPAPISALGTSGSAELPLEQVREAAAELPPLPSGPAPEINLMEVYLRTAAQDGTLDDRDITIAGEIVRENGVVHISRVIITCCAADARAMSVRVAVDTAAPLEDVPEGSWVRAVVRAVPGSATPDTDYEPQVRIASFQQMESPREPYESAPR